MNELIKIETNDNLEQMVSVREMHEKLGVAKDFTSWFKQQAERLNLTENIDYTLLPFLGEQTGRGGHNKIDYLVPIDIAKHIAMISGGEKAHEIRSYFIQVERAWNTPEQVMARALQVSNKVLLDYKQQIGQLEHQIEKQQPKVLFADAVAASVDSILIRDLAKLIAKNGVNIGEKRLFEWMRENEFLQKTANMPTQKAVELEVLEVKEGMRFGSSNELKQYFTTKVTGKGQVYFVNKFLKEKTK